MLTSLTYLISDPFMAQLGKSFMLQFFKVLLISSYMQALHGLRRNTECFYLDCRNWAKVIGVELQGTMLFQGHLLKWPVMLRNISSGKAMCLGERDGPACLILLQMMFVPLLEILCVKHVFLLHQYAYNEN